MSRPIDDNEEAICEVFSRMDWEDETYDEALDYVASTWQMSRNRLDHLLQVWCAVAGVEYPG